jgi:hypothetical protein
VLVVKHCSRHGDLVFLFLAKLLYEIAFFSSKLNIKRSTAPSIKGFDEFDPIGFDEFDPIGFDEFDPIGFDETNISYPAGTSVRFANNWLLICEDFTTISDTKSVTGTALSKSITNGITLKSPSGTIYRFSYSPTSDFTHLLQLGTLKQSGFLKTFYVTDIIDIYGNWLAYDYKNSIIKPTKDQMLLTKIRSKEGADVSLSNDGSNITGISHGDTSVVFTPQDKVYSYPPYDVTVLNTVTKGDDDDQKVWTYVHDEWRSPLQNPNDPTMHRGLVKIKNPFGGIADFKYQYKIFCIHSK